MSITSPIQNIIITNRDPTSTDINYLVGQGWINFVSSNTWELASFSTTLGTTVANWQQTNAGSSGLNQLQGNTGGPISSIGGLINLIGSGSVSVAGSGNTLTISSSASGGIDTLTGNSGGAISPDISGNLSTLGSGSITIVGSTNTTTTQLTGLTNHNILVGSGTPTITNVAPSATSGIPLISQGSSSDPSFGTAVVAGGGTGDTSFTAYSIICGGTTSTGALQNVSGVGTSGQILTSNGAATLPTWQSAPASGIQTLTGNTGGAISPSSGNVNVIGSGSISVAGSGSTLTISGGSSGLTWSDVSAPTTVAVNSGSFAADQITLTLPASPTQGSLCSFIVDNSIGPLTIQANTSQFIRFGNSISSSGGTATSVAQGDSLSLVFRVDTLSWIAYASVGNWTTA